MHCVFITISLLWVTYRHAAFSRGVVGASKALVLPAQLAILVVGVLARSRWGCSHDSAPLLDRGRTEAGS